LYLLDSNDPLNHPSDRGITGKLYGGGQEMRLVQEMALGIGGWRLIEALGKQIDVCHLNEGHAAFVTLERARCFKECNGVDFWEAMWATRSGNVFTTHTPVAAGIDTFHPVLMAKYGPGYADGLGVAPDEIVGLGRKNPDDRNEPFNMTYLAMHTCFKANGVSHLHGEVSRGIFQTLYPLWPRSEVPICHITNGVHVPSWDSPWADEIWTKACGKGRWLGKPEDLTTAIAELDDETLWAFRGQERADLVHHVRRRHKRQLARRGAEQAAMDQADHVLDANSLTLGFARRFTEYKRPNLLLRHPDRLLRLLTNPAHPVQLIIAGKAHPNDDQGKGFISEWAQFAQRPDVQPHVVFLEDYDIALAQEMVQGVDVWLNTPRHLNEASGTSGMKVLVNGGLNLSELDGWWAEAYSEDVGWALGDGRDHAEPHWDDVEAEQLYHLLEEQIAPMFYERDAAGIPRAWVARIRKSMSMLTPRFSTNRMVREYLEQMYLPAATEYRRRAADEGRLARDLRSWERLLKGHWQEIRFGKPETRREGDAWIVEVPVYLGEIPSQYVQVELFTEVTDNEHGCCEVMRQGEGIVGAMNSYLFRATLKGTVDINHFTPRVIPYHPDAEIPAEMGLISWQR
jgi:starch phosphorylase